MLASEDTGFTPGTILSTSPFKNSKNDDDKENREEEALPLAQVRSVAKRYKFKEAFLDESSDMLLLRGKSRDCQATIQVYYRIGTVAICIQYTTRKKKCKDQIIHQGLSLKRLSEVLSKPEKSHGSPLFRFKKYKGMWNSYHENSRANSYVEEFDSIRRWRYCAAVTNFCSSQHEIDQVVTVIYLYDELQFFEKSSRTNFHKESRFSCGSKCVLESLLMEIARDHHGAVAFYLGSRNMTLPLVKSECPNESMFLRHHSDQLEVLKVRLLELPHTIRNDVIHWLFSRGHCGSVFLDAHGNVLTYNCAELEAAHDNYGRLYYDSSRDNMCHPHGIKMSFPRKTDEMEMEEE